MKQSHTLYICYFGLREPLVQTQVLPYLREIKKLDNLKVSILTFEANLKETWTSEEIKRERESLAAEGIDWYCLPYHKSPSVPATVYDTLAGARLIRKLIREKNVDILHARIHVPALMGAIAKSLTRRRVKLIFDIRGFFPEEYTDAGRWEKDGLIYRKVKDIEKRLLKDSDGFVVLTEKAREILFPESKETNFDSLGRPVEVIPCCVDLKRFDIREEQFRREVRARLNIENRFVVTYTGSLGTWYLAGEMADFMQAAREKIPSVFALILTQSDPDLMRVKLLERGFGKEDFHITKVAPSEIPQYLSASDLAISFIRACYSKLSSSPTKIAEYLASGLPVICNRGVGDVDKIIEDDAVGAVVDEFNRESYLNALQKIEDLRQTTALGDNCKASALKNFDLEKVGGLKYRRLYQELTADNEVV